MAKPSWCFEVMTTYLTPGVLGQRGPFVGIEVDRIEIVGVVLVLLERDLEELAGPFLAADHRVDAPVDEQAELGLAEPLQAVGRVGLGRPGGRRGLGGEAQGDEDTG